MIAFLGLVLGLASLAGAGYLLSLWHEDQRDLMARGEYHGIRTWTVARVLAYVAVVVTVASNYLGFLTFGRILGFTFAGLTFDQIRSLLTPFTLGSLIILDSAFTVLAAYLWIIRKRSGRRPL